MLIPQTSIHLRRQSLKPQKTEVTQWKNQDVQKENKQQKCQVLSFTVFNNKNCQAEISFNMQPKKLQKDVQLKKPAMKLIGLAKDKNCQATMSHTKQKNCKILTLKVKCSGILTRNVKKMEIMLCSQ